MSCSASPLADNYTTRFVPFEHPSGPGYSHGEAGIAGAADPSEAFMPSFYIDSTLLSRPQPARSLFVRMASAIYRRRLSSPAAIQARQVASLISVQQKSACMSDTHPAQRWLDALAQSRQIARQIREADSIGSNAGKYQVDLTDRSRPSDAGCYPMVSGYVH